MLAFIDVFSKRAYSRPLKSKMGSDMAEAFDSVKLILSKCFKTCTAVTVLLNDTFQKGDTVCKL